MLKSLIVFWLTFVSLISVNAQHSDLLDYFTKGIESFEKGEDESAIQYFEIVYSNNIANPTDSISILLDCSEDYLGYIYYCRGNISEASKYSLQYTTKPLPFNILSRLAGIQSRIHRGMRDSVLPSTILSFMNEIPTLLEGYLDEEYLSCLMLSIAIQASSIYYDFDSFQNVLVKLKDISLSSSSLTPNARAFFLMTYLYYATIIEFSELSNIDTEKMFNELNNSIDIIPGKYYTNYVWMLCYIADYYKKPIASRHIAKQAVDSPYCCPERVNYLFIHQFLYNLNNDNEGFIDFIDGYVKKVDITYENFNEASSGLFLLMDDYLKKGMQKELIPIINKMIHRSKEMFGTESYEYLSTLYNLMYYCNNLTDYSNKGEYMASFMEKLLETNFISLPQIETFNYFSIMRLLVGLNICGLIVSSDTYIERNESMVASIDYALDFISNSIHSDRPNNFYTILYDSYCKLLEIRFYYQLRNENLESLIKDEELYMNIDFLPDYHKKMMYQICASICSYRNDYDGVQSYLDKSFPTGNWLQDLYLAALYARKGIKHSSVEDICISAYNEYLRIYSSRLQSTNPHLANELGMTEEENDISGLFTFIASRLSNDKPFLKSLAFDFLLLNNGTHLNLEKELSRIAESESDSLVLTLIKDNKSLLQSAKESSANGDYPSAQHYFQELSLTNQRLNKILSDRGYINDLLQLNYSKLAEKLAPNDVIIEFAPVPKDLFEYNDVGICALLMQKGWEYPEIILIDYPNPSSFSNVYDEFLSNEKYGNELWGKILERCEVNGNSNIYFTSHPLFQSIPFENLPFNGNVKINNLFNIYRLSSFTELLFNETNESIKYASATLFGGINYDLPVTTSNENSYGDNPFINMSKVNFTIDTLPYSLPEINDVSLIMRKAGIKKKNIHLYTGELATEEQFKNLSNCPTELLLISTHGFVFANFNVDNKEYSKQLSQNSNLIFDRATNPYLPMNRSFLVFAGAKNTLSGKALPDADDGILSAQEISNMKLWETDLAVLSSCNSGLGISTSDGVMGLMRGLKLAGVHSVLMTLWPVDDKATYLFMKEFFTNLLLRGQKKAESLYNAQNYLINYEGPVDIKVTKTVIIDDIPFEEEVTETVIGKPYSNPKYWAGFVISDPN